MVRSARALAVLWFLAAGCSAHLDEGRPFVSGEVRDSEGQPLARAVVRFQGSAASAVTDDAGGFALPLDMAPSGHITAGKEGYYNGGQPLDPGKRMYRIVLRRLPPGDNQLYRWLSPRKPGSGEGQGGKEKACQECHQAPAVSLFDEWDRSAHARSATNPLFLAFFNGLAPLKKDLGYKRDFPHAAGNCAACHAPAMALRSPFGSDPTQAAGVEKEGIFCDLCHKVEDVTIDTAGGRPGILSMTFKRPPDGDELFLGPLDDVFPGPDGFRPLYRESRYCAACHHGTFWNLLVYSEYREWADSAYARKGIQCQDCHMKPIGRTRRIAASAHGGIQRRPEAISNHSQLGLNDEAFMRAALALRTGASAGEGTLAVTVTVRNVGAGHHLPTGSPMRNMLLLVEAADGSGAPLPLLSGSTLPPWAGVGDPLQGHYAGLPGRGFAKVLVDLSQYPAGGGPPGPFVPLYPAPYWRPTRLERDTRIPAEGEDISTYVFRLPEGAPGPVRVATRLIFRRTFRSWVDASAGLGELILAEDTIALPIR